MVWLVAGASLLGLLALLPGAVRALRRSMRGNGRVTGVTLGLGLVFAHLFEPAKVAATEEIEKQRKSGGAEKSWGGENF